MIINNKVYSIHIPRTAGRFVHKSLELSNQKIKVFDFNFIFRKKMGNSLFNGWYWSNNKWHGKTNE